MAARAFSKWRLHFPPSFFRTATMDDAPFATKSIARQFRVFFSRQKEIVCEAKRRTQANEAES